MGQAKQRGTAEQRQAAAIARLRGQFPASVTCNNCQAELTDIAPMDVRGIEGMRLAGAAHCPKCEHDTWVLDGTKDGLSLFREFLDASHGEEAVSMGVATRQRN